MESTAPMATLDVSVCKQKRSPHRDTKTGGRAQMFAKVTILSFEIIGPSNSNWSSFQSSLRKIIGVTGEGRYEIVVIADKT